MGEITLITGGARSGKSRKGEEILRDLKKVLYIATALPIDTEMEDRIARHKQSRPGDWETLEAFEDLHKKLPPLLENKEGVILDCLTLMVCNLMFKVERDWDHLPVTEVGKIEQEITEQSELLIRTLEAFPGKSVLITNELGMGLVPPTPLGRHYRDIAGRINQKTAARAGRVIFMVSGLPLVIKEEK